jgi:membrane protease YdiL (CAAX protease family)
MNTSIIKDFIKFLKRPDDTQLTVGFLEKIKIMWVLLILEIAVLLSLVIPLDYLVNKIEIIKEPKFNYSDTLVVTFFLVVIIAPVLEEPIFRYFLRHKGLQKRIFRRETWDKIFPYLVYGLSIIFGLIHLFNYLNDGLLFYLFSPLVVLSQLFGGFVLSFIRVRINFIWGMFSHALWNFIFAILLPIFYYQFATPYAENTDAYEISITEKPFFVSDESQYLKIDSLNQEIKSIELKQISLQNLLDTLYQKDQYYVHDVLINLDFRSNEHASKDEFLKILIKEYEIK